MSATRPAPALLDAEGLDTFYDQSHVLRAVSLVVRKGETVGLMGRNGMGKTTLIRTVMGLVRQRRGEVWIDGRPMTGARTAEIARQGLAYVPEGRGIFASLTVAENLAIAERAGPGGSREWTRARVLALFPRLAERLDNRGNHLSGGEQQMLAFARALLTNPRLLILDEATEGLAPLIRDEIWRVVAEVRATGMASLIVDKNVAELARVADRIVILVRGAVAFEGPPATLTADPELMLRHLGV